MRIPDYLWQIPRLKPYWVCDHLLFNDAAPQELFQVLVILAIVRVGYTPSLVGLSMPIVIVSCTDRLMERGSGDLYRVDYIYCISIVCSWSSYRVGYSSGKLEEIYQGTAARYILMAKPPIINPLYIMTGPGQRGQHVMEPVNAKAQEL